MIRCPNLLLILSVFASAACQSVEKSWLCKADNKTEVRTFEFHYMITRITAAYARPAALVEGSVGTHATFISLPNLLAVSIIQLTLDIGLCEASVGKLTSLT